MPANRLSIVVLGNWSWWCADLVIGPVLCTNLVIGSVQWCADLVIGPGGGRALVIGPGLCTNLVIGSVQWGADLVIGRGGARTW